jgi:hypothetical protein
MSVAEQVAEYVLTRVRLEAPHTWRQAPRSPALFDAPSGSSARVFAERRIRGVSELASRGLLLIAEGFPVHVSPAPFSPDEVLALQARGRRCASLIPAGEVVPEPHGDALEYVLHDLCHLAKFADPRYHDEQVGFFQSVERALSLDAWRTAERALDAQWHTDRVHISSDMNGSSVFLFACSKAKLKLAASRTGQGFRELFERWLDALELTGAIRDAAGEVSSRSDQPAAAEVLANHFREAGVRSSQAATRIGR